MRSLAATREAVTNAAVHAGSPSIDVFAELGPDAADVFVRDIGSGFDPEAVPADRRGLADSIVGRLERIGGAAVSPDDRTVFLWCCEARADIWLIELH